MALKKTIDTPHGLTITDAYHRVENVVLDGKDKLSFRIVSYADPNKDHIIKKSHTCAYDLLGNNPISQAYAYLKVLPEFSDAEDV